MKKVKVYTDGASKGNPGKSGAGVVLFVDDTEFLKIAKPLGIQTNNYAEYYAVFLAVYEILRNKLQNEDITFYMDSNLVVNQLKGNWKIKNKNIKPLFDKITSLLQEFKNKPQFIHIPREQNTIADQLANIAVEKNDK